MPNGIVATTERTVIRPWRVDEAERFFDMHRRVEVARWIGGTPMADRAEADALIARYAERLHDDPRFGVRAVVERSSGVPAGSLLLKPLPDGDGEIEIGWHLHPDAWGRGLATEAAAALLARAFADGLDEVWAVTHPDNDRSVRVCEKIGLRYLGVTRRWYHEPSLLFWAASPGSGPGAVPTLRPWPRGSGPARSARPARP